MISYILEAKQNNELLLKNHQSRPTGSMSLPEANATNIYTPGHGQGHGYGQGQGRGHGRSCGRHNSYHCSGSQSKKKNNSNHHKWNNLEAQPKKRIEPQSKHAHENECYKYRMKGH